METRTESSLSASVISRGFFVLAISTLEMPFCNIGVITMKMISRTSMTSAIGVTLISEVTSPRSPPPDIDILLPLTLLLDEVVDQLRRRVGHLNRERFNLIRKDVVGPHRRHSHEKTEGGGDQCFGNTSGYCRKTGCFRRRHILERVDDTDRCSEKA